MSDNQNSDKNAAEFFERPVLRSERLTLRAPLLTDVDDIVALANNKNIHEMTARIPFPYTVDDAESFLARPTETGAPWAIIDGTTNEMMGVCRLGKTETEGVVDIGYWIGEPFWGKGYSTEAVKCLLAHTFDHDWVSKVRAEVRSHNVGSIRVLEKAGFVVCNSLVSKCGQHGDVPVIQFSISRAQWQNALPSRDAAQ